MSAVQGRTARLALVAAVAVLLVVWWASARPGSGAGGPERAATSSASAPGRESSARASASASASSSRASSAASSASSGASDHGAVPGADSGLPTVQVADLPAQAQRTLDLIEAGGPYPYSRDGVVFQNRERLLPRRSSGYYHEYTVPTPGEGDRGARRIITGRSGELYWTADHYGSFAVIVPDEGGSP